MVDPLARLAAQRSVKRGKHGEAIAHRLLDIIGVRQIVHIETGWRVVRMPGGRIINAVPLAKVPGDWRGIMPGGRSVMAEVKERKAVLVYSDLEPHQHAALLEHNAHGGLSLVVVVYTGLMAAAITYPCPSFQPRMPGITPEMARMLCTRPLAL